MIQAWKDPEAERLFLGERPRHLPQDILGAARRKLLILHAAEDLNDLRIPPGNRLEKLREDREGQHSIRINKQWRICFRWSAGNAFDVEIVDYH